MVNIEKIVLRKRELEEENKLLKNKIKDLENSIGLRDRNISRLAERIKDARRVLGFGSTGLVMRKRRLNTTAKSS